MIINFGLIFKDWFIDSCSFKIMSMNQMLKLVFCSCRKNKIFLFAWILCQLSSEFTCQFLNTENGLTYLHFFWVAASYGIISDIFTTLVIFYHKLVLNVKSVSSCFSDSYFILWFTEMFFIMRHKPWKQYPEREKHSCQGWLKVCQLNTAPHCF